MNYLKMTQNEILEELSTLTKEVKEKNARIERLKDYCKTRGSFATKEYVCSVSEAIRWTFGPMDEVVKHIPRDELIGKGILKMSKVTTVKVTPKGPVEDLGI